ncbi:hypothetical protein D3C77_414330 [compost metagenome]
MAEAVVHLLEAINVQQQHGQRLGLDEGAAQALLEQQSIGQAGDGVVVRQPFKLRLGLLELAIAHIDQVVAAVELGDEQAEQPGAGQGEQEQRRCEQAHRRPATQGAGRQLPEPAGHIDIDGDRMALEQQRIAPDHPAHGTLAVGTAQGQLEARVQVQPRGAQQAVYIGNDGDIAPVQLHAFMALEKHRSPVDQPAPALVQLQRPGQHRAVVLSRPLQQRVLLRQVTVVDTDEALVAAQRVHIGHHIARRDGDMANVRDRGDGLAGHVVKVLGGDLPVRADQLGDAFGLAKRRTQLGLQGRTHA